MILLVTSLFFLYQVLGDPIAGGTITRIHVHPWLASIQTNNRHFCVGSIVSESMILTAAHCGQKYPPDSLSVRVGSSTIDYGGSQHKVIKIKCRQYRKNIEGLFVNDVALMRVSPSIRFGVNVKKVQLASRGHVVVPRTVAIVAGWGQTSDRGRVSSVLRSTSLLIVDNAKCSRDYEDYTGTWMSSHGQICAAAPGADACKGDSGGPLMVGGIQIGVASWGRGCARPDYPGVYTNVSVHRHWIDKNTKEKKIETKLNPGELNFSKSFLHTFWESWVTSGIFGASSII